MNKAREILQRDGSCDCPRCQRELADYVAMNEAPRDLAARVGFIRFAAFVLLPLVLLLLAAQIATFALILSRVIPVSAS